MRPLSDHEDAVLRAIVLGDAPDDAARAALLSQLDAAQVTGPSCTCGCASVGLYVDRAATPPAGVRELNADAVQGDYAVGFRILLDAGYLDDVEFFGYGESDHSVWPPLELLR